ncbi:MAG: hypothetical protein O3A39_11610, partial [Proteobacteria bacterium]|nr:hypothetical protein [Pseudomonadota bacterium]
MFSKFLFLIFFLTFINSVNAQNNTNSVSKSFTETLTNTMTNTLTNTLNKTETNSNSNSNSNSLVNSNKQIKKSLNTNTILNNFFSNYKLVGEVNYSHLFWDLYDAKLFSETGDFEENKFALVLKYNTKISSKSVVKETINQLKKQKEYTEVELDELTTLL